MAARGPLIRTGPGRITAVYGAISRGGGATPRDGDQSDSTTSIAFVTPVTPNSEATSANAASLWN